MLLNYCFIVSLFTVTLGLSGEAVLQKIYNLVHDTRTNIDKVKLLLDTFTEGDNTYLPQNKTYCVCVPYHLCNEAVDTYYGEGVINIRIQENPCPTPGEICCMSKSNAKNSTYLEELAKCGYPSDAEFQSAHVFLGNTTDDTVTTFGEYPWTALVYANFQYVCTGSLIHPKVALTSAVCVQNKNSEYTVRLGEWDRTHIKEPLGYENRKVKSVFIHPKFKNNTLVYNAALLIVDFPYILQPNIKTVCLINESDRSLLQHYKQCVATGWGKNTPTGRFRKKMKKVNFSLLQRTLCQSQLRNSPKGSTYLLHKSFLCAVNAQNYDLCLGDHGGPLVCPISEHPLRFQQVGISSWNMDCFGNYPTVFTKVSRIRDWIDGEFENLGLDKKYYTYN